MKKLVTLTAAVVALMALSAAAGSACGEKGAETSSSLIKADAGKAACAAGAVKQAAKKESAAYALPEGARQVAARHAAECKRGNCDLVNIHIEGMTCGNCEQAVQAALAEMKGVNRVLNVSYKDEIAQVCAAEGQFCAYSAATALKDKGFKAEVIPAVAVSGGEAKAIEARGGKAGCCAAGKKKSAASCDAKDKKAKGATDEAAGTL